MTGFGRAEGVISNIQFTVEVKSLNHRFLDIRFRMPSNLSILELPLSERIRSQFDRGSFEVAIKFRPLTSTSVLCPARFVVDETALNSLLDGCDLLSKKLKGATTPSLEAILFSQRVLIPIEENLDTSTWLVPLAGILDKALSELKRMRAVEGKAIQLSLEETLSEIEKTLVEISENAKNQAQTIEEKLHARIKQWKLEGTLEASRLEWEVAFYADRSDITEELARLRAHLIEFVKIIQSLNPVGRKLDFMTQELHREVNTLASKTILPSVTQLAINIKTNIEKLREQVQNVE